MAKLNCYTGCMIKGAIFDMDGLLIDSEPLWDRALYPVLDELNVKLNEEDRHHTLGQGVPASVEYWYHQYPWQGKSREDVVAEIIDGFLTLVKKEGVLKPGVHQTIEICRKAGLSLAIASSSPMEVIDAVVDKLAIRDLFDEIYSGQSEAYTKPHPGVFITVAGLLDVSPLQCVVFEDAPSGVLAAKAARMKCIAVPEPEVKSHKFIRAADIVLDSLEEFDQAMLTFER
jgi:HAD superfamily hydrolase (TIGR01509 family)